MGFGGGSRAALRPPYSYEGFRARRVSGALRPSLHVDGARPGREGVPPFMPAMPSYIEATRGDARFHSVRRAGGAFHDAGRALHVTALGPMASCATPGGPRRAQALHRTGGCAATPSIAVRFASTHSDGHLLLLVLDLMLLGRCSVDGPSLALGSHARLS